MRDRAQPGLDPLPEAANFVRRFARRSVFTHRQSQTQRILVIVAHDDARQRENAQGIERLLIGEHGGRVADALAADRSLVEDKGERLVAGPDEVERRRRGFDIGDAGARRTGL